MVKSPAPMLNGRSSARGGSHREEPGYYAFLLMAEEGGPPFFHHETMWVGWHDIDRRIEIRRSRPVGADIAKAWENAGIPWRFIDSKESWIEFLVHGGGGLVESDIAKHIIPHLLEDRIVYPYGARGFSDPELLEPGALNRAPNPKLRMAVLNRDKRKCRVCGRRPEDYVDLELHVHHIRPWRVGGLTNSPNLITLCQTCHKGLDPHFDEALFDYLENPHAIRKAVDNYRTRS